MVVSQAFKDLLEDGPWASSESAQKQTPEDAGLTRTEGWPIAYEQINSGKTPERTVFNQLVNEITSALIDIAENGVLPWDTEVNYSANAFVTTTGGLWIATVATGPAYGNPTNPDTTSQTVWRRY